MPFYIYILYSAKLDKYYTGSSEDVSTRLNEQHNRAGVISTKTGVPWVLKHMEEFETRTEAVHREYEIKKKKSRKYIEWLISSSGRAFQSIQEGDRFESDILHLKKILLLRDFF